MKIIIPEDFLSKISNKHLLLDTSFFIDATIHKNQFQKIIEKLKNNNNTLVTIDAIKAEFLLGSEKENRIKKEELINNIIDAILPTTSSVISDHLNDLIKKYGVNGRGISMGDLILGATLQRYPNDLLLVTKNPKDFPKPTTELTSYFLMDMSKGLQVYAILSKK